MRLTQHQRSVIREASSEIFGPDSVIKLFGSRTIDHLKGRDIDLLIESNVPIEQQGLKAAKLAVYIQRRLGDQKIDVMCVWPGSAMSQAHKSVMENGLLI